MATYPPGARITSALLNSHAVAETSASGLVAASGFSVVSFSGRRVNGITTIFLTCERTGAKISEGASNNGNIADTTMCTIPSGWRPPESINAMWVNGQNDGECTIDTAGVIVLRSTSGTQGVNTGQQPSVAATWISG